MYESISKNNELENEMTLDMSYFWYSDKLMCLEYIEVCPSVKIQFHQLIKFFNTMIGIIAFINHTVVQFRCRWDWK